jgi:hypothetical protein
LSVCEQVGPLLLRLSGNRPDAPLALLARKREAGVTPIGLLARRVDVTQLQPTRHQIVIEHGQDERPSDAGERWIGRMSPVTRAWQAAQV